MHGSRCAHGGRVVSPGGKGVPKWQAITCERSCDTYTDRETPAQHSCVLRPGDYSGMGLVGS